MHVPSLNFDLGEDIDLLRESVAAFAAREIAPLAATADEENVFPAPLWRRLGAQGLLGMMSPLLFQDRVKVAALALKERLPAIGGLNAWTEAGFLASYGAPLAKCSERTAEVAVRIINGARPADTPLEQVNEFEFAVNMKTANALGIRIPQSILVRADKVIE